MAARLSAHYQPSIHGSLQISIQQSPRGDPFSCLIDCVQTQMASIYPPTWIWDCTPNVVVQTKTGAILPDREPHSSSKCEVHDKSRRLHPAKMPRGAAPEVGYPINIRKAVASQRSAVSSVDQSSNKKLMVYHAKPVTSEIFLLPSTPMVQKSISVPIRWAIALPT